MVDIATSNATPSSVEALDELLTTPSPSLINDLNSLNGDIMVIGSAGKMGPTLTILAQRAVNEFVDGMTSCGRWLCRKQTKCAHLL